MLEPAFHLRSGTSYNALYAATRPDQGNPRPFLEQNFQCPSQQAQLRVTRPSAPGRYHAETERNALHIKNIS